MIQWLFNVLCVSVDVLDFGGSVGTILGTSMDWNIGVFQSDCWFNRF